MPIDIGGQKHHVKVQTSSVEPPIVTEYLTKKLMEERTISNVYKIRIFQLYSTAVRTYLLFNCQRHKCHLNSTFTLKKINNIRVTN